MSFKLYTAWVCVALQGGWRRGGVSTGWDWLKDGLLGLLAWFKRLDVVEQIEAGLEFCL